MDSRSATSFSAIAFLALAFVFRRLRSSPLGLSWPPSPETLRKHRRSILLAWALVAAWYLRTSRAPGLGEAEQAWLLEERAKRREKLYELLQLAYQPVAAHEQLRQVLKSLPQGDTIHASPEQHSVGVTEADLSSALADLRKVHREDPLLPVGYAVLAAWLAQGLVEEMAQVRASPREKHQEHADLLISRLELCQELDKLIENSAVLICRAWYEAPALEVTAWMRTRRVTQLQSAVSVIQRLGPHVPYIAAASALSVVRGMVSASQLYYQGLAVSVAGKALTNQKRQASTTVSQVVSGMVLMELLAIAADLLRNRFNALGQQQLVRALKVEILSALLRQDVGYIEGQDMYRMRQLIGNIGFLCTQLLDFPINCLESGARILSSCLMLWSRSPRLALMMAVALPARLGLSSLVKAVEKRVEENQIVPDLRGHSGIKRLWAALVHPAAFLTLRSCAREPKEAEQFSRFLANHDRYKDQTGTLYRLFEPVQTLLERCVELGGLWYGGKLCSQGSMEIGDVASMVMMAHNTFDQGRALHGMVSIMSDQVLEPMERVADLLERQPTIGLNFPPIETMPDPKDLDWSISFEDVEFSYPGRPGVQVLKGMTMKVKGGSHVGILGDTGAGKSSVLLLLQRLYDPTSGSIMIGDHPLKSLNPLWLRQQVAWVPQEPVLIDGSIKENLFYGAPDGTTDEEAERMLEVTELRATVFDKDRFPQTWHTDVGKDGSHLSGGEKQRLAFARALLRKPRLLLLDEPTSAMDEATQASVMHNLHMLREEQRFTVITVAHRLSNFQYADSMVVISDGKVAEQGTVEELQHSGGIYAKFYEHHMAISSDHLD